MKAVVRVAPVGWLEEVIQVSSNRHDRISGGEMQKTVYMRPWIIVSYEKCSEGPKDLVAAKRTQACSK